MHRAEQSALLRRQNSVSGQSRAEQRILSQGSERSASCTLHAAPPALADGENAFFHRSCIALKSLNGVWGYHPTIILVNFCCGNLQNKKTRPFAAHWLALPKNETRLKIGALSAPLD